MSPPPATTATPSAGRLRLTPEGLVWSVAVLLLGGLSWLKSLNLLLLLAYVMAGLLLLNGVLARLHVRRVTASRRPLPPVYAGEQVRSILEVRNHSARAATVNVLDQDTDWHIERIALGEQIDCPQDRSFPHRGRVRLPAAVVWSGFPFGLLRYERPLGSDDEVIILPAVGEADVEGLRRWLALQAGVEGRSRKVLRRATAEQADVRGVRPYRPGDSLRSVHWRSSARRGELMVREYDTAPSPELVLLVEPWLPANPTAADCAAREAALSLTATILRAWCRAGETRVTVVVCGEEPTAVSGPPTEAFARDGAVPLALADGRPAFPSIPSAAFGRALGRSARVVVSSRPNTPLTAALTRSTGRPFIGISPTDRPPWYQPPVGTPDAA